MTNITDQDIRQLAYKLWEDRGFPFNNHPEEDWVESERILTIETVALAGESVQAAGAAFDPSSFFDDLYKIGPRNDYQYKISFVTDSGKLRWIDNFRILGDLDPDILRDFGKCYPKSYGNFQVTFKAGSMAENRGEVEANCFYLNANDNSDRDDVAYYANLSLLDALNGTINPFAPMHRTGPNYVPYMFGATNPSFVEILMPYKITNDSGETIWCKSLEYNPVTGLWRYDDCQGLKANSTSDRNVLAMFERI